MINYQTYAERMRLQPADVFTTSKKMLGLVDHYVVYVWNNQYGEPVYAQNDSKRGVHLVTESELFRNKFRIRKIRKFSGDETQRYWAVERAKSLLTARYDLEKFNCESFANYVQYGQAFSTQVNAANSTFLTWMMFGAVKAVQQALV